MLSLENLLESVDQTLESAVAMGSDSERVSLAAKLFLGFDAMRAAPEPFDRTRFVALCADAVRSASLAASKLHLAPHDASDGTVSGTSRDDYAAFVGDLYAACWRDYTSEEYEATVRIFLDRLVQNGVDVDLAGLRAADIGCGSARNTVALVRLGAREAVGLDFSEAAISDARARIAALPEASRIRLVTGSATALPPEWGERFDFVVSNGVVHHTPDPQRGVREVGRILRRGGRAFFMVYGQGGLFWGLTERLRQLLGSVSPRTAHEVLTALGVSVHKRFFCLDHWFTIYQEQVSRAEFERRLSAAGFGELKYLGRGAAHDSTERLTRYPDEADLIGEPDMRYVATRI